MNDKPIYNFMQADGSFISFKESMDAFSPTDEEFSQLRSKIVGTIGTETSRDFDDTLRFLLTLIREMTVIHEHQESVTVTQKKLKGLSNHLKKLQKYIENDISDTTRRQFYLDVMALGRDREIEDPLFELQIHAQLVSNICDKTQARIKGQKPEFTPMHMRQVLAEELARELNKMGIELKKYRDGEFVEVLKHVLKAVPCKVHGKRISISIPSDLFKLASKAIDEFPEKEPYPLLAFR